MELVTVCKDYFSGFHDIYHHKKNYVPTIALAVLKILSYFTVVIPLAFAAIYGAASIHGRINKKQELSKSDQLVNMRAHQAFRNTSSSTVSEQPKVPESHKPTNKLTERMVLLSNDYEIDSIAVGTIMMTLDKLHDESYVAFFDLFSKCKDNSYKITANIFGDSLAILKRLRLLQEDDTVSTPIKNVVLSAVFGENDLNMRLRSPLKH